MSETAASREGAVLIVEDQALMRYTLRNFLWSAFPGLDILEAANGATALHHCTTHKPSVVLMDVGLPDANGIELAKRLKALLPDLKVIVVSNYTGEPYVSEALAAGAETYVLKDDMFTELVPAVAKALGLTPANNHPRKFA